MRKSAPPKKENIPLPPPDRYPILHKMNIAFDKLKLRCVQPFQNLRDEMSTSHSNVRITWCFEENQIDLEAMIQNARLNSPDVVDFVIGIQETDTQFEICADIIWGDGDGTCEKSFNMCGEDAVVLVENIQNQVPEFIRALRNAVVRGFPAKPRDIEVRER